MRPSLLILLVPAALACANRDDAHDNDTTTAAAERAALTPADVEGTWYGVSRGEQGDSIFLRWTSVHVDDTSGYFTAIGFPDTITYRVRFDGDSVMTASQPYAAGTTKDAPMMVYRTVGRMEDGKLVGTVVNALASNPDSVVSRGRWEASREQP